MAYLSTLAAALQAEIETTLNMDRRDALIIRLAEIQQALGSSGSAGAGDASAALQAVGNTALQDILIELRDDRQIDETVWYDKTDNTKFYVRRATVNEDTGIVVISFFDVAGTPALPVVANLIQTTASDDVEPVTYWYRAIVAGTGYAVNEVIQELQLVKPDRSISTTIWFNRTQNTVIATPTFADLQIDNSISSALASIDLKTPTLGQKLQAGSVPVTIASDQSSINTNGLTDTQLRATPIAQNLNQISGTTTSVNNGGANAGTQRVAIASDNTPFAVKTDLTTPGTTNKVSLGADVVSSNITQFGSATVTLGTKPQTNSMPVTLASDTVDINPNRTIANASFNKITDGTLNLGLLSANPVSTDIGLPVRQIPNALGNTNVIASTLATALFSRVTDGTNQGTVKAASTLPATTDTALVVTLRDSITTGGLTDTQLRATPVNQNLSQIAGTTVSANNGIANAGTQRVTIASDNAPFAIKTDLTTPGTTNKVSLGTDIVASNISQVNGTSISLGAKTTTLSFPVTLPTDVVDINPNRTIGNAGFQKITDGSNTLTMQNALPLSSTYGLPVRQVQDSIGNTQVVASTIGTALFSRLTDGINNVSVKPASVTPVLADIALVVTNRDPSLDTATLVPGTIATRHGIIGGQYLVTAPTLTNSQQAPLRLTANGSLVVSEDTPIPTRIGQVNPVADTAIAISTKVRSLIFTNTSAAVVFVQFHSSATALTVASVPVNGFIYRVPANSTLTAPVSDFGDKGTTVVATAGNFRIGISSTFGTYTAVIAGNLALCSLSVETLP